MPTIIWLKDGMPVSKRVTVSNTDGTSQLLIPSAGRSDSGIYTIIVKNIVGQEMFSVEIRVTGERAKHIKPEIEFVFFFVTQNVFPDKHTCSSWNNINQSDFRVRLSAESSEMYQPFHSDFCGYYLFQDQKRVYHGTHPTWQNL